MKNRSVILLFCLLFVSCVQHEVMFTAKSELDADGSLVRRGRMEIKISGERNIDEDSLGLWQFYSTNYVLPDENLYNIRQEYGDSSLTIYWEGKPAPEADSIGDYIHRSKEGPSAINNISIKTKNRWIYKDIIYVETFSDPVDTSRYFPLISDRLSRASDTVVNHDALGGIRNKEEAEKLLDRLETEAGLDLFRGILKNPAELDSLSGIYDERIADFADSLAGFAGVKQNPDSLGKLIHHVFDAAWDTLLSDYPGLFGSFPIDDTDVHNFRVEVSVPGCVLSSNSDKKLDDVYIWEFGRLDFFAREFNIEIVARQWRWINIIISLLLIAIILFIALRPVRRGMTG